MDEKRRFQGIWIPAEIWLDTTLTMQEKIFLVEIDSLDNESGCFAGNQYFADFFGISKTRVSLVINNLVEKGYLKSTIIYKDGSKQILNRVLNICRPPYPTTVLEGVQQKLNTPMQQKLKDNNTKTFNKPNNNTYTEQTKQKFKKPTIEEIKSYCKERNNNVDAEAFYHYYESKGWKVGNQSMKSWQSAVITWEKRDSKPKEKRKVLK